MRLGWSIVIAALLAPAAQAGFVHDATGLQYVPHGLIVIQGDEVPPLPYASGIVAGLGTPEDPFIIEGWEIQAAPHGGVRSVLAPRDVTVPAGGLAPGVPEEELRVPLTQVTEEGLAGGATALLRDTVEQVAGIRIQDTIRHYVVRGNYLHGLGVGIVLQDAPNVVVEGNFLRDAAVGVLLSGEETAVVRGNTLTGLYEAGVALRDTAAVIEDNVIHAPVGVELAQSLGSTVRTNRISGAVGIDVSGLGGHLLEDNLVTATHVGLRLERAGLNHVFGNTLSGGETGVSMVGSGGNLLAGNTVAAVGTGFDLEDTRENTLEDNTLASVVGTAIRLRGTSEANLVERNTVSRSGLGIALEGGAANVAQANALTRNSLGLLLSSGNNVAQDNLVQDSPTGILARDAPGTVLAGNAVQGAERGLVLERSPGSVLSDNVVTRSGTGVLLQASPEAVLDHNSLLDNACGAKVEDSPGTAVRGNNFYSNEANGLEVLRSAGTWVRHNNFGTNLPFGLLVQASGPDELDATGNYWGATTGPSQPGDFGKGDPVGGLVDTSPYATAPHLDAGAR